MSEKIIKKSVSEQYAKDVAIYSIEVNRKRSFADVKDGLKLVQRRILDSMCNRLPCWDKLVKTAEVVGDVMGKSHPHGDCHRYCTPVYLLNGEIKTMGSMYDEGIREFYSLGVDPETLKTIPVFVHDLRIGQYTDKVYHIELSNGTSIQCTSNHPIMLVDGTYKKAEDIKITDILNTNLMTHFIEKDSRPFMYNNGKLQDIVYNYYYGPLEDGYVKHHIDGNVNNNMPDNFKKLSRADHAKLHKDYIEGLAAGRNSMFNKNGAYYLTAKDKNSKLMKIFNKDQNFRRFKYAIGLLIERGLECTLENYESLRGEIYNLPIIDSLIEKGYGTDFESLIDTNIPTVGEIYQESNMDLLPLMSSIPKHNDLREYNISNHIYDLLKNGMDISYESYMNKYPQWMGCIDQTEYDVLMHRCLRTTPIITNIWIEDVDQEPMYDFTVDTTNNMIIPMIGQDNAVNGEIPFICTHNSSISDAVTPMCNWFSIKVPLIKTGSNMGSMQGDGAAAPRYTEIMLSDFAKECVVSEMKDSKDVVDWVTTYNNRSQEPEYFPTAVPLLLINGVFGLGVGMMTQIPKHNLTEVIDATLHLIDHPEDPVVLIPDHCMACEIIDTNWKAICNKGNGKYIVRSVVDIEYDSKRDNPLLVIKSLPDSVVFDCSKGTGVKYKILEMVKDGKLPQILDIEEHSHGNNMRIIIRLRKGSDPNYVREVLYKTTQLQDTYNVNFEVLDGYTPLRMSYKSYLQFFIEQRKITKFRLYCNMLQKYRTKFHEKDAYVKVLESGEIDKIIKMIRAQKTTNDDTLIDYLIKTCKITDLQAKFIINANLKSLSAAYLERYKNDVAKYSELNDYYMNKIVHDELIIDEIKEELITYKKKYGEKRKCRIISKEEITNIPKGDFKIVITENNYIKKLSPNEYVGAYRGDNPKHIIQVENTESILLFSSQGKVFNLPVHKIPMTEKNSIGSDIRILIKGLTSDIMAVIYEPVLKNIAKKTSKHYLTVVTANNYIKKLDLEDFISVPPSGLIFTKINSGDYVKEVAIIPEALDIILYSNRRALRVPMKEIPNYKRSTLGVSAMNLSKDDIIDGMSVIYPDATDVVVVTESGRINKFDVSGLQVSNRYKAGSSVIKLGKGDKIHSIYGVNDRNILKITTKNTREEIPVKDIQSGSSLSQGIKCISTKGDMLVKTSIYTK